MKGNPLTWIAEWLEGLGNLSHLGKETVTSVLSHRISGRDLIYQIHFMLLRVLAKVRRTG